MDKNSELSEDELKNVAGGKWGFCLIFGGSTGGTADVSSKGTGACYYVGVGIGVIDPDNEM